MLSAPELAHGRTVNADIIALIRGGGPDEQFSVFENPAAVGTHIADVLRTPRDSQQHVAELRAQNNELPMQLRQVQMQHAAEPLTPPPHSQQKATPVQTQQNAPTVLRLVLALLIGMLTGVLLLLWFLHRR